MPYPSIAFVVIGVTIAGILYYMFSSNEHEREHPQQQANTRNRARPNVYRASSQISSRSRRSSWGVNKASDDCSICLGTIPTEDLIVLDPCKHAFHDKCIKEWKRVANHISCPNCRGPFT